MAEVFIALENIRSIYNIGAIIRTAEFYGIKKIFLIGYSGVEHRYAIGNKEQIIIHHKLQKTALSALDKIKIEHYNSIDNLKSAYPNMDLIAIEQDANAINIYDWHLTEHLKNKQNGIVLILGNEVTGVEPESLKLSDKIIEIPRIGAHPSLNVEAAAAIAISYVIQHQKNEELTS